MQLHQCSGICSKTNLRVTLDSSFLFPSLVRVSGMTTPNILLHLPNLLFASNWCHQCHVSNTSSLSNLCACSANCGWVVKTKRFLSPLIKTRALSVSTSMVPVSRMWHINIFKGCPCECLDCWTIVGIYHLLSR